MVAEMVQENVQREEDHDLFGLFCRIDEQGVVALRLRLVIIFAWVHTIELLVPSLHDPGSIEEKRLRLHKLLEIMNLQLRRRDIRTDKRTPHPFYQRLDR